MIRMDKLTIKAQEALAEALETASSKGHPEITALHLLHALASQEQGAVASILQRIGVPPAQVADAARTAMERMPRTSGGGQPGLGREANKALDAGWTQAQRLKDEYLSTEHILLGILEAGSESAQLLKGLGVSTQAVLQALKEVRGTQRVTDPNAESTYEALQKYSRDLTQLARANQPDRSSAATRRFAG